MLQMTFILYTAIPPIAYCWGHNRAGRSFLLNMTAENDDSHPLFNWSNTLREITPKRRFVSTSTMQGGDAALNFCHAYTACVADMASILWSVLFFANCFLSFSPHTDWAACSNSEFQCKKVKKSCEKCVKLGAQEYSDGQHCASDPQPVATMKNPRVKKLIRLGWYQIFSFVTVTNVYKWPLFYVSHNFLNLVCDSIHFCDSQN